MRYRRLEIEKVIIALLLLASSFVGKAQVYTHGGEKILARDTVALFKGKTAEALLIDNDGNYNTFERFALSRKFNPPYIATGELKGKNVYYERMYTQYVDTLAKVFTRIEGENKEFPKYFVIGARIESGKIIEKQTGNVLSSSGVNQIPHFRMEVPEKLFNELKDFLKLTPVYEEHVVKKPDRVGFDIENFYSIEGWW